MAIPVGSGKNACYGYEDDADLSAKGGAAASSGAADASLTCHAEGESQATLASGATASEPQGPTACDREADYITVSAGVGVYLGTTVSVTEDRYHEIYTAGGVALGTPGLSASIMYGRLRDPADPCQPPTEDQLHQFLAGDAVSVIGGSLIASGVTRSSGMIAQEIGFATPQLSAAFTVGGHHPHR